MGNLAVYSSIFANEDVKNRIINIYNNDGPGFKDEITETKEYNEMIHKVETLAELKHHWFSNTKILLNSYKSIDAEDKKMILETLSTLFKIVKDNLLEESPMQKIKDNN